MELKDQVCSLELAKRLKELGVKQESLWYWQFQDYEYDGVLDMQDKFELVLKESIHPMLKHYSAFTVAELGEMLEKYKWEEQFDGYENNTEANARAKMLIYLLENKLIKER